MKLKYFQLIAITALILLSFTSPAVKKSCSYCAAFTQNGSCVIVNGKTECNNGKPNATYYKYNSWDGNPSNCISGRCETQVTLYNEQ